MLKQISVGAYWVGLVCAALAILLRILAVFGVWILPATAGGSPVSYMTFFRGAILLFLLAIASGFCCPTKT